MPKAGGHYSTCIEHNGILYISGQLPFPPGTREIGNGIEAQTRQILENIDLILTEAGSKKEKLLNVRIYVSDISLWSTVNEVYSQFMQEARPTRCVVPTKDLHYGCLIEIEATAFI